MDLPVMERFERVLAHAHAFDPDAYFLTGDFCAREPKEWVFEWLAPRLKALGKPTILLPGNHDDREMMRRQLDLPGTGNDPIVQELHLGEQSFLFLDTRYAEVGEDQVDWLRGKFEQYPEAHVVMHHPPIKMGLPFMDDNYSLRGAGPLQSLLRERPDNVHVFCGHYHCGRTVRDENLLVHLCPPTSFFIKPHAEAFEQDFLPPAYQQLIWTNEDHLRVIPVFVTESPAVESE